MERKALPPVYPAVQRTQGKERGVDWNGQNDGESSTLFGLSLVLSLSVPSCAPYSVRPLVQLGLLERYGASVTPRAGHLLHWHVFRLGNEGKTRMMHPGG